MLSQGLRRMLPRKPRGALLQGERDPDPDATCAPAAAAAVQPPLPLPGNNAAAAGAAAPAPGLAQGQAASGAEPVLEASQAGAGGPHASLRARMFGGSRQAGPREEAGMAPSGYAAEAPAAGRRDASAADESGVGWPRLTEPRVVSVFDISCLLSGSWNMPDIY
jgi:hypothetical protein